MAELNYQLTNPNYTIYHRAALGGLAATIRAWGETKPEGITAEVTKDRVRLAWSDELADQEAVRRILAASFKLTEDKMIDLPGQGLEAGTDGLRLAIHNGIMGTFLDHNSSYDAESLEQIVLKSPDEDGEQIFTYKALSNYAHREAVDRLGVISTTGTIHTEGLVPKWAVLGAFTGARPLKASGQDSLLLVFLMVACGIYHLRPRTYKDKAQYCVVIPDVADLIKFTRDLHRASMRDQDIERSRNTYLGRVVGGAEEAALRFLIDLEVYKTAVHIRGVAGCLAIATGKVSWDKKQNNRSIVVRLKDDYAELNVFLAAKQYFHNPKVIRLKDGTSFVAFVSPIPELIAANLAAERHWCVDFKSLVSDKEDFKRMRYAQGGLSKMKDAVKDADDKAVIRAFQDAWRLTMSELYKRARRDGLDENRLLEVERERMRNAILRTKTADALANWFLRFCADATKGNSLGAMRDEAARIRTFMFNQRNFERFQNLCLFALVSYASDTAKSNAQGEK